MINQEIKYIVVGSFWSAEIKRDISSVALKGLKEKNQNQTVFQAV